VARFKLDSAAVAASPAPVHVVVERPRHEPLGVDRTRLLRQTRPESEYH